MSWISVNRRSPVVASTARPRCEDSPTANSLPHGCSTSAIRQRRPLPRPDRCQAAREQERRRTCSCASKTHDRSGHFYGLKLEAVHDFKSTANSRPSTGRSGRAVPSSPGALDPHRCRLRTPGHTKPRHPQSRETVRAGGAALTCPDHYRRVIGAVGPVAACRRGLRTAAMKIPSRLVG